MGLQATPTGLSVVSTYNGLCLRISWYPAVDPFGATVQSYKLYRSEIPYGDFTTVVGSLPGITYFDKPPSPNDNIDNVWWYRVSSFDGFTESLLSGACTFLNYASFDNKPVPALSWSNLF